MITIFAFAVVTALLILVITFEVRQGRGAPSAQAPGPRWKEIRGINRSGAPGPDALQLEGNLVQTPLHDIMQYLALSKKSGELEIRSGRRTGSIHFQDGLVVRSFYRGKDELEGIFEMLDLGNGDFIFHESAGSANGEVYGLEVIDIIMKWMAGTQKRSMQRSL